MAGLPNHTTACGAYHSWRCLLRTFPQPRPLRRSILLSSGLWNEQSPSPGAIHNPSFCAPNLVDWRTMADGAAAWTRRCRNLRRNTFPLSQFSPFPLAYLAWRSGGRCSPVSRTTPLTVQTHSMTGFATTAVLDDGHGATRHHRPVAHSPPNPHSLTSPTLRFTVRHAAARAHCCTHSPVSLTY